LSTFVLQILTPFGLSSDTVGGMGCANILVGTFCAQIVGYVVDKRRVYRWPLTVCYAVSTVAIFGIALVATSRIWSARPDETANVLSTGGAVLSISTGLSSCIFALYVLLGIAQNCAIPIAFEFAVEISFPLEESTSGTLLMLSGNFLAMLLIGLLTGVLWNPPSPRVADYVLWGVVAISVLSTVLVAFVRAPLKRLATERGRQGGLTHDGSVE
jgi:hypothetical protein